MEMRRRRQVSSKKLMSGSIEIDKRSEILWGVEF